MKTIAKRYGIYAILCNKSNPNGDPEAEGAPRQDLENHGLISNVSQKRRLRDIVLNKSFSWNQIVAKLNISPEDAKTCFDIYVQSLLQYDQLKKEIKDIDAFHAKYWDARLFGNTILDKGDDSKNSVRSGVISMHIASSVAPVTISRMQITRVAGVEEGKKTGMGSRSFVDHALYIGAYEVNPERAFRTGVTERDVDVFVEGINYMFEGKSEASTGTSIVQHWTLKFAETKSIPFHKFHAALAPRLKNGVTQPRSLDDYDLVEKEPAELKGLGELTKMM